MLMLVLTGVGTAQAPSPVANISLYQSTITRQEARWIYTLKTRYWQDGSRITVYHLPFDHTDHVAFVREVLEMQPSSFTKNIQSNINSGTANLVKEVKNHGEMLNAIQSKFGAVGYLSKDFLLVNGAGHVDVLKIVD